MRNIKAAQERNARRIYEFLSRQQHNVYNFHGPIHVHNHQYFQQPAPIQTPIPSPPTTSPTIQVTPIQSTTLLTPMQNPTTPQHTPTPTFRDYSSYTNPPKSIESTTKPKKKVTFSLPKQSTKSFTPKNVSHAQSPRFVPGRKQHTPKTLPKKHSPLSTPEKSFQLPRLPDGEAEMTIVMKTVNAPPIPNLLNIQHTIPRKPRKHYSKIRKVTLSSKCLESQRHT